MKQLYEINTDRFYRKVTRNKKRANYYAFKKNLSEFWSLKNLYAEEHFPAGCRNSLVERIANFCFLIVSFCNIQIFGVFGNLFLAFFYGDCWTNSSLYLNHVVYPILVNVLKQRLHNITEGKGGYF